MLRIISDLSIFLSDLWFLWNNFWYGFNLYRRIEELNRLIKWAKRKKLTGVRKAYQAKLLKEVINLQGYNHSYHQTAICAYRYYLFIESLKPAPRYHSQGSTSHYRSRIA